MDQELLFARTLEEIKKKARRNGNLISEEEVVQAFSVMNLSKDQLLLVFDYLEKNKIQFNEDKAESQEDGFDLTDEDFNCLLQYQEDLKSLGILEEEEKRKAYKAWQHGDKNAENLLLRIFLPQVITIAKLYVNQGVLIEDLIGEGNVALAEAVKLPYLWDSDEEAEGVLANAVMNAMEQLILDSRKAFERDRKITNQINRIALAAKEMSELLGRKVSPQELCVQSGIDLEEILNAMQMTNGEIGEIEYG